MAHSSDLDMEGILKRQLLMSSFVAWKNVEMQSVGLDVVVFWTSGRDGAKMLFISELCDCATSC